jgi:hypothetical protein
MDRVRVRADFVKGVAAVIFMVLWFYFNWEIASISPMIPHHLPAVFLLNYSIYQKSDMRLLLAVG